MPNVQDVFKSSFDQYAKQNKLPPHFRKAAYKMMACRTAVLGGHKQVCPNGHVERCWYNSCKHRSCPQCNSIQVERWLEFQNSRVLNCSHYQIVFTIPSEFRNLWVMNSSLFMNMFFRAVKETLFEFLRDPKYLGAVPGIMVMFHSWGRDLSINPHMHVLVTDGGLSKDGEWKKPKKSCFLPARAVMKMFRGKLSDFIRKEMKAETLIIPDGYSAQTFSNLVNKLQYTKKWNVRIQERYDHAKGLVTYFARYVRGGPLKNSQIEKLTETEVVYRFHAHKDNPDGKRKNITRLRVTHGEFFRRFLAHVPESGRQVVRSYGIYAHTKSEDLNTARELCGQPRVKHPTFLDWQEFYKKNLKQGEDVTRCPKCQSKIVVGCVIPPQRGSPDIDKKYMIFRAEYDGAI